MQLIDEDHGPRGLLRPARQSRTGLWTRRKDPNRGQDQREQSRQVSLGIIAVVVNGGVDFGR